MDANTDARSKSLHSRWWLYCSPIFFVADFLLGYIAVHIDDRLNHGNFFSNMYAWRVGILWLPLAIVGVITGVIGIHKVKGLRKTLPFIGLVLCLFMLYASYWEIVNASNAAYWGV